MLKRGIHRAYILEDLGGTHFANSFKGVTALPQDPHSPVKDVLCIIHKHFSPVLRRTDLTFNHIFHGHYPVSVDHLSGTSRMRASIL